ncbi:hypothetical protein [Massilia horti]|uniref:Uncharacterized protein n=1 Tax=Massilia horti TaxID=2562153 RepID=A0A4Y9SQE6_9BURK|nr:hypothetical protein [Massilia horti]TFW27464.1 hypothetical protein E4O92_23990 [Massilia horti]
MFVYKKLKPLESVRSSKHNQSLSADTQPSIQANVQQPASTWNQIGQTLNQLLQDPFCMQKSCLEDHFSALTVENELNIHRTVCAKEALPAFSKFLFTINQAQPQRFSSQFVST